MTTIEATSLTDVITDFTLGFRFEDLAPDVLAEARRCFLDTLGVALVGFSEPATQMMLRVSGAEACGGSVTILGADIRSTPLLAALVNGYAAHALDYDDTQHRVGTHMSAPVVAAALALAEVEHRSGRDLLTAYIVGFEVGTRLGRAASFARHLGRLGIHATGYLGHLGAVAATGRLTGLDAVQMRRGFGIAAGHASGLRSSFGTMGKAQNAGNAAHNAVLSALLAREGFTGPEQILDGDRNLFSVCGAATDPGEMIEGLGHEFEITKNTLKIFACAGWRNPIVEASIRLADAHDLQPGDIEKVNVWAWTDLEHLPNYREPRTGLESKFSAEHAAAVALIDRAGGVAQFADDRVADPVLAKLRSKVELGFDETLGPYQIRAEIETRQGNKVSHFVPSQKGDHANPLTWDELLVKFKANTSRVLPPENVDTLVDMITNIDTLEDVNQLTRLCRPDG